MTTTPQSACAPLAVRAMPWLLLAYAAASLWHFAHNGAYLQHYPNLPPTWLPRDVYAAGAGLAFLGLCGYLLYRRGLKVPGLSLLMLYAAAGFGGLLHYTRAPPSHHTATMNLTIWTEAVTAAVLLLDLMAVAMYKLKPVRDAALREHG